MSGVAGFMVTRGMRQLAAAVTVMDYAGGLSLTWQLPGHLPPGESPWVAALQAASGTHHVSTRQ